MNNKVLKSKKYYKISNLINSIENSIKIIQVSIWNLFLSYFPSKIFYFFNIYSDRDVDFLSFR